MKRQKLFKSRTCRQCPKGWHYRGEICPSRVDTRFKATTWKYLDVIRDLGA